MKKLFTLKRNVKFRWLWLDWISELLDPYLFNDYIKEMCDFTLDVPTMIELSGSHAKLEEIYELVKMWRQQSYFVEHNFLYII
uniref:BACK domain-containing protein n=1 Tax=Panagrolaimus sp. ES5 TaxID=591445 RepID=A0AC34G8X4_9BILA